MKRYTPIAFALVFAFCVGVSAQVPMSIKIQIAEAEDARRYDAVLENLMKSPNAEVRKRAALAAGRIGDERALWGLRQILNGDDSVAARAMAAFALGEIESVNAADNVRETLLWHLGEPNVRLELLANISRTGKAPRVHARLVEAAGKIAAANSTDPKSKELGKTILDTLEAEHSKGAGRNHEIVLLALTAALRARPENADKTVAKFLTHADARIRADAANTLSRLRSKNANDALRALLNDADPIARANAARALGAAEDKGAVDVLLTAATEDAESRVRVSAIRALAAIRDARAAVILLKRGEELLAMFRARRTVDKAVQAVQAAIEASTRRSKSAGVTEASPLPIPIEQNELLEIATTLGRLLTNKSDDATFAFLKELAAADGYRSGEIEVALARVAPKEYSEYIVARPIEVKRMPHALETATQGMRELATLDDTPNNADLKKVTSEQLKAGLFHFSEGDPFINARSVPTLLRAFAVFKPAGLETELRNYLANPDLFIRSTAADLLGDQPKSKENIDALKTAFTRAVLTDKVYNDAQLSILDALHKLDKKESVGMLLVALNAPDYLLRQKAFRMLADKDLQKDFPGIPTSLENARKTGKDRVLPYNAAFGTKLGQVLNTRADYVRGLSRKNGSVKAVLTTEKGTFTIDFTPEEAPLTVDSFIKLARSGYFNGVEVHRVVPNFVMQDGDPRGDGNGGPGWSIRCEVNLLMYDRGMVGMALSGKDTGGSQWFVTHSPQPHLDGGYTIFGRVNEAGMKVVDNIVRGDKILRVGILELVKR